MKKCCFGVFVFVLFCFVFSGIQTIIHKIFGILQTTREIGQRLTMIQEKSNSEFYGKGDIEEQHLKTS